MAELAVPDERQLAVQFGDAYSAYHAKTRGWL